MTALWLRSHIPIILPSEEQISVPGEVQARLLDVEGPTAKGVLTPAPGEDSGVAIGETVAGEADGDDAAALELVMTEDETGGA